MNFKYLLNFTLLATVLCGNVSAQTDTIQLKGNGYITSPDAEATILSYNKTKRPPVAREKEKSKPAARIDEHNGGISDWYDKNNIISTYFRVEKPGAMELKIVAKGNSTITVSCLGKKKKVKLSSDEPRTYYVGKYNVKKPGHIKVDIQGKKCDSNGSYGNVYDIIVNGQLGELAYIRKNYHPHFGRRGPSVHLNYRLPKDKTIEWF